nr:facilitated trehalose transporter Tret1-like [Leptinotarsa decemlineata]
MGDNYLETATPILEDVVPSKKLNQYLAATSVSLGAFCAGTVLSWTSPALTHIVLQPMNQTNTTIAPSNISHTSPGFKITENEGALVGSILTIGALVSAIPVGYLADRFGRKVTIIGLAVSFLINWVIICFSSNLIMVLVARFFAGIGLGGICVVAPIYIGEMAEARNRGTFGSFFQLFLSCGILFCCVVGYFTDWVGLALVLGVTPILFGGSFLFMPETPVYLVGQNKVKQAETNLKKLRGSMFNIREELREIERQLLETKLKKANLTDVITNKANLRAVISIVGVLGFQQMCGINAIVFYTVTIFEAAGTDISPFLSAIITNLVQVVVSYFSVLVIEKANRKFFLMISSAGMMLCMVSLAMFFHLKLLQVDVSHLSFLPLASTMLFMVSFSFGYGPVPWMLLGELFAPEIKGIASGIGVLSNWIFAFVVTFSFPLMNASFGNHVTFYTLSVVMALATVFVYYVVPETRGKTLAEIQQELNG